MSGTPTTNCRLPTIADGDTIDGNVWSPDAYPQGWTLEGEE